MILVECTINGTVNRLARQEFMGDTYPWKGEVVAFDQVTQKAPYTYGGFADIDFGTISFAPTLFVDDWPPPDIITDLTISYLADGDTDESNAEDLFVGTLYLSEMHREKIVYDIYGVDFDYDLLDTTTDYDGTDVPKPRAFGEVFHVNPIRVADVGGKPTYHKGFITGTIITDWHVYDDGINVDGNVTDNNPGTPDGTFSLSVNPVGEVTMSGVGAQGDLLLFTMYLVGVLSYTMISAYQRDPSVPINYWADSQMKLIDFYSELCAYGTHLSFAKGTNIYLVDLYTDFNSLSVDEFEYFQGTPIYHDKYVKQINAQWVDRAAVSETIGNYVKDFNREVYAASPTYQRGETINAAQVYNDQADEVAQAIGDQLAFINAPKTKLRLSMELAAENIDFIIGRKYSYIDSSLYIMVSNFCKAHTVRFDLENEILDLDGIGGYALFYSPDYGIGFKRPPDIEPAFWSVYYDGNGNYWNDAVNWVWQ